MNLDRIGSLLVKNGCLDEQKLDFCLKIQKSNGNALLGEVLKHYNFVNDVDLAQALAHQIGWDLFRGEYLFDEHNAAIFEFAYLLEKGVFPLKSSIPTFVLSATIDTSTTDYIQNQMKVPVRFLVGIEPLLRKALERQAKVMAPTGAAKLEKRNDSLLSWFDELIYKAVLRSASDIHIEPSAKAVEIRFRVDGMLYFMDSLHLKHLPRVVNIVFNKADVNISDFHHFHDARFSHMCLNHELDVRVSHIPSVHGSALVLRLLDKGKMALGLMELGYSPLHWDIIEANLIRPDGVSLIVGPTGCGKTTSLYAMLNVIKSISKKIVTIEDPVEVKLPLTTQLQINEQRGVMFSESVRAFLRHDPDIMLIGEIRDGETAKEAMRASLTGHKVFATLHATRANEALLRLNDLGIETHYIANCVTMVMAQRLVRKLCQHCKFSLRVDKKDLKNYEKKYLSQDSQVIFKERGCQECVQGFSGRSIVAEVLSLDGGVRSLLFKEGFQVIPQISFEGDAQRLIRDGITSLSEIVRVLG